MAGVSSKQQRYDNGDGDSFERHLMDDDILRHFVWTEISATRGSHVSKRE